MKSRENGRPFRKKKRIRMRGSDRVFYAVTTVLLVLVMAVIGYPVIYVISCSFSSYSALSTGRVLLWPVDPSLDGYRFVFSYPSVWRGYLNSFLYTFASVAVTMFLTILAAYPLSKKNYQGRKGFMVYFFITMMFSAGLIPTYLTRAKLGLVGNPGGVILAGCVSVMHVLILRTAFKNIPADIYEAATVDGANELQILVRVTLPLIKATVSVIMLYSIVGCWNDYFNPMLYLRDPDQYTLQQVLRTILTGAEQIELNRVSSTEMIALAKRGAEQIRYALIVVSTVPVFAAYLVLQKHFKKGVMIGSVKG